MTRNAVSDVHIILLAIAALPPLVVAGVMLLAAGVHGLSKLMRRWIPKVTLSFELPSVVAARAKRMAEYRSNAMRDCWENQ